MYSKICQTDKELIPFSEIKITEISPVLACELNKRWHSTLPELHYSNVVRNKYYICFGAYYGFLNWIAVGIWSSPIAGNRMKNADKILELRRLAISDEAPKNFASWFLSRMIKRIKLKFPQIEKLISYQDTSKHIGTIYKASNWIIDGYTKFRPWNETRKRNKSQTFGDKVRWAYYIKH